MFESRNLDEKFVIKLKEIIKEIRTTLKLIY